MYKVACPVCGKISFTAVRIQWLTSPFCPYCGEKFEQKEKVDNNNLPKETQTLPDRS